MAALGAALDAARPEACISRYVNLADRFLVVGERPFDLDHFGRIRIFGAGKASEGMAQSLLERLGDRVSDGVVVVKHAPERGRSQLGPLQLLEGDHPVPGQRTQHATATLLASLGEGRPDDLVIFALSGGASSLLALPGPALDLPALSLLGRALLNSGLPIDDVNAIRRAVDPIKSGGLARAAAPATVIGLLLSDVPGDQPALIGSGPTVFATDDADALGTRRLLAAHPELAACVPDPAAAIRPLAERQRPDDLEPPHNVVVGGNLDARTAAAHALADAGFPGAVLPNALVGEAFAAGEGLATLLAEAPQGWPLPLPGALVAGGETTVRLQVPEGTLVGKGGRNLELALGAVEALEGHPGRALVTLATDGDDGNSGAAGAVVTGDTAARARDLCLDLGDARRRHDALSFFEALGDVVRTGPTGTNVCDLALLVARD